MVMKERMQMNRADFRSRLQLFFNSPDTLASRLFSLGLVLVILASVVVGMCSTLKDLSDNEWLILGNAEYFFASVFVIEYILRLYAATDRLQYATSFYGIIDLIAIVPVFFIGMQNSSLALRLIRLLSLIRLLKVIRYWGDLILLMMALKESRGSLIVVALCALALAVVGGNLLYYIEPDNFNTAFDGVWWTLVTMSTVGYGDIVPHSALGKVFAGFGMFLGIGIFAIITATITSKIHVITEKAHTLCPRCKDVIAISSRYCMHCGSKHI